jgi:hypothetical protein
MTIRLKQPIEDKIAWASDLLKISKSELVRRSVLKFIQEEVSKPSPWEAGQNVFGMFDSGNAELSTNRKTILREKLSRKFK